MTQLDRFFHFNRDEWAADPARMIKQAADKVEKNKKWIQAAALYDLSNSLHPQSGTLLKLAETKGRVQSGVQGVQGDAVAREIVNRAMALDAECEPKVEKHSLVLSTSTHP